MATGSLTIRNDKYFGIISWYENTDGIKKRRQKWVDLHIPVKNGKMKAQRKLKEIVNEFDEDQDAYSSTISDIVLSYIENGKERFAPSTYKNFCNYYKKRMESYFSQHLNKRAEDLSPKEINDYLMYLHKDGISDASVCIYYQILNAAFRIAFENNMIRNNVMDKVKRPKCSQKEMDYFETDQINDLLEAAKKYDIYTEVLLAVFLGARKCEILGLQWENIDFKRHKIRIENSVTLGYDENKHEILYINDKLKTSFSKRTLSMPESLSKYLLNLREVQALNKLEYGKRYNNKYEGYICVSPRGYLHYPNYVTRRFNQMLKEIGLPHIRFHDLRHSCATMLLEQGFSMKAVQKQLGHGSYVTTANIYSHVADKTLERIAEKTNEFIKIPEFTENC